MANTMPTLTTPLPDLQLPLGRYSRSRLGLTTIGRKFGLVSRNAAPRLIARSETSIHWLCRFRRL